MSILRMIFSIKCSAKRLAEEKRTDALSSRSFHKFL